MSVASLASEGDRLQRRELAAALVLPDLVDGRADVAVAVEVDRAERTFVVDVLVCPEERDRLLQLCERHLLAGRAADPDEVALDLRGRSRAAPHGREKCHVRGVERGSLEAGVGLGTVHLPVPERVEGVAGGAARSARRGAAEADDRAADRVEGLSVLERLGHQRTRRVPPPRADARRRELLERLREVDDHPALRAARDELLRLGVERRLVGVPREGGADLSAELLPLGDEERLERRAERVVAGAHVDGRALAELLDRGLREYLALQR